MVSRLSIESRAHRERIGTTLHRLEIVSKCDGIVEGDFALR
jgi:hypothetical protein